MIRSAWSAWTRRVMGDLTVRGSLAKRSLMTFSTGVSRRATVPVFFFSCSRSSSLSQHSVSVGADTLRRIRLPPTGPPPMLTAPT